MVSTKWEQREKMYGDVRDLIDPGFLTHTFTVQNTRISLRSLYPRDHFLLKHQAVSTWEWRVWCVAASIWMVDGVYVLGDLDTLPDLVEMLNRMSPRFVELLYFCVLGFFNRVRKAAVYLEPYLYEEESRRSWMLVGKDTLSNSLGAGLPGWSALGKNTLQAGWIGWNSTEDERHASEYQWSLTKTSLGPHAPKAVTKLDSADRSKKLNENLHRESVIEKFWLIYCGVLTEDGKSATDDDRQEIHRARTPDELSEEMQRWVSGKEDFHDRIVNGYKKDIREKFITEQQEREEALQRAREEAKKRDETMGMEVPVLVGYTPDQIQELVARRGPPGVQSIVYGDKAVDIYERYLQNNPSPGHLVVKQGQVVVQGQQDSGENLDQLLAHRRVTLK